MSIARAIAVMGAGLQGYGAGQDEARRQKRQEEDDAFRAKQRQRQELDWQRADEKFARDEAERKAMEQAAAPVTAEAVQLQGPPVDDTPMPMADRVAGQYVPQGQGAALADTMNAPAARMRRAAGAVRDPVRAAQMEGQAGQAELGQMQLAQAKRDEAVRVFDDGIRKAAGSWDSLTKFLNDSGADGKDGAVKFSTKREGGKVTLFPIGPDGTALGPGSTYTDDEAGRAQVAFLFARGTSPEQKLKHILSEKKAETDRNDKEADNKRADRLADSTIAYQAAMGDAAKTTANARGASLEERLSGADKLELSNINRQLETINAERTKAQMSGMLDEKNPGYQAVLQQEAALRIRQRAILAKYNADAQFDPFGLRGDGAPRAESSMERVARAMKENGDTTANFDIGGVKGTLGKAPESSVAQTVRPAVQAVRQASADARAVGATYQALEQRFRDSKRGGPPLTPEEIAAGRQFGLIATR